MSDPKEDQSGDSGEAKPLDQTTAPVEHLQEGQGPEPPLDETQAEMREFLGSEEPPPRRRRRGA